MPSVMSVLRYLVCVSCIILPAVGAEKSPRNVLFIAIDDLRPELGCYGAKHIHSPNIDAFAKSALVCERAYCQQAVCNPSRTSLMTGMRPGTIGVLGNHSHFRTQYPNVVTLPQHFKQHGYHAQAIGKIYHGVFPDGTSNTKWDTMGDPQSWSVPATRFGPRYYFTEEGIAAAKQIYQQIYRPVDPKPEDWTQKLVFGTATESPEVPDDLLYDGKVATAAIDALKTCRSRNQPFFLAVGFIKPHSPYIAPRKYFDLYENVALPPDPEYPTRAPRLAGHGSHELRRYTDQPKQGEFKDSNQRRVRHAYFACVSFIDAQVGRLLNALKTHGLAENTVVCLFGDHGYHLGEQGLWGKTTNFELDTRVPLIIRTPGMTSGGKTTKSLVELVDLYPTLSELAGLPQPPQLEGKSFARLLDDPSTTTKSMALSQYPRGRVMGYSVRNPTHRLTQWVNQKDEVTASELYAYSDGLVESNNIAPDSPETVAAMSRQLQTAFAKQFAVLPVEPAGSHEISFENQEPGEFKTLATNVGVWKTTEGRAIIDDKHAKTGRHCLQLAGGTKTSVELTVESGLPTDGHLLFAAERWTKRTPFSFRIEKLSGGKWTEIFNGNKQVRVGRAFLSKVTVPLMDASIERLRFSVTSPPSTGILIDDLRFAPATKQKITNVEMVPMTLPALVGTSASALLKLKIETEGILNPLHITELTAALDETSDLTDIKNLRVLCGSGNTNFKTAEAFGSPQSPQKQLRFVGHKALADGTNYVWITCTLADRANIDHHVGVTCKSVTFSNGKTVDLDGATSQQRLGIAVRNAGDDEVHTYRIPGLATTNDGTLIGVYDVRRRSGGDLPGDIDVGMSRSTDGGRSWEPMKIIMDMGDDPKWRYDGIGDPSVLVDRTTGTVWVAATWSHGNRSWFGSGQGLEPEETGQFMLVKSDDDGVTWSKPVNITKQVKTPEWCFLLQGPGKGITLSNGTIVFPAQYQDAPNLKDRKRHRLPHSTVIYSKDHGASWQTGTGAFDDTTEAQVVEISDNQLMLNCRYNREGKRVVMTTSDLGGTWKSHPTNRKALIEPGACMASLINVGRETGQQKRMKFLLFSNPNSSRGRHHITIKASTDEGLTWPKQHHLLLDEDNGAGYSCMSMIDDETVGILYEGSQAQMTFQRIPLESILNADPAAAPKSVSLSRVFGDHMVLQANSPIRVWGRAVPHQKVEVRFGSATANCTSNSEGDWLAELPSQPRNSKPQDLVVNCNNESVTAKDVLVGEVWLCAGQSNMEWPVQKTARAAEALRNSSDEQLRLLNFAGAARGGSGVYGPAHFERLTPDRFSKGAWQTSVRESAGSFSAVGYYFGTKLRRELKCPVGLINVSIGGTPIESWIDAQQLGEHPQLSKMLNGNWLENEDLDVWCRQRARSNLQQGLAGEFEVPGDEFGPNHSFKPGFMYSAAVKPFAPMTLKGVLWYQGESNAESRSRVEQYNAAFPLLVHSWRAAFQNPDMAIGFVQLPAMGRPNWPVFREYQRRSLNLLRNVGMAITIDTGHPTNVHPTMKTAVGERLAAWALVQEYGKTGLKTGPLFSSKNVTGNRLTVTFSSVGGGLRTPDGSAPNNFEIAGKDGVFHDAESTISDSNSVVLSNKEVTQPVHARFAWSPFPEETVNLFNSEGMPASPFTTEKQF